MFQAKHLQLQERNQTAGVAITSESVLGHLIVRQQTADEPVIDSLHHPNPPIGFRFGCQEMQFAEGVEARLCSKFFFHG